MGAKCAWLDHVRNAIMILALAVIPPVSHAAQAAGPAKTEILPFSGLQISLRTSQTVYVVGEPIDVHVEVRNAHEAPVRGTYEFGWFCEAGTFWLAGELVLPLKLSSHGRTFGPYRPYRAPLIHGTRGEEAVFGPGFKRHARLFLVADRPELDVFFLPGKLEISVQYYTPYRRETVDANSVWTTLRDPEGADAEALAWLHKHELTGRLGYSSPPIDAKGLAREDKIAALRTFLDKYGSTVYAPHAHFTLGRMYFYRKEYAKAIGVFDLILDRYPKSPIAEDACFLIALCYDRREERAKAEQSYDQVLKRYPDTVAAQGAERGLARIRRVLIHACGDPRLDAKITQDIPENTPLGEAVKVLSAHSGVPLRVHPELYGKPAVAKEAQTVGEFLFWAGLHEAWVREPDGGYRLMPVVNPR